MLAFSCSEPTGFRPNYRGESPQTQRDSSLGAQSDPSRAPQGSPPNSGALQGPRKEIFAFVQPRVDKGDAIEGKTPPLTPTWHGEVALEVRSFGIGRRLVQSLTTDAFPCRSVALPAQLTPSPEVQSGQYPLRRARPSMALDGASHPDESGSGTSCARPDGRRRGDGRISALRPEFPNP